MAYTTYALLLWSLGYPERAAERTEPGLELARRLDHPFTFAYTLFHIGFLDVWRRRFGLLHERASSALDVAEEHDYQAWRALGMVLQGVAVTGAAAKRGWLASIKGSRCTRR